MGNGWHCNGAAGQGECSYGGRCDCGCACCRKERGDLPWDVEACSRCYNECSRCVCASDVGEMNGAAPAASNPIEDLLAVVKMIRNSPAAPPRLERFLMSRAWIAAEIGRIEQKVEQLEAYLAARRFARHEGRRGKRCRWYQASVQMLRHQSQELRELQAGRRDSFGGLRVHIIDVDELSR